MSTDQSHRMVRAPAKTVSGLVIIAVATFVVTDLAASLQADPVWRVCVPALPVGMLWLGWIARALFDAGRLDMARAEVDRLESRLRMAEQLDALHAGIAPVNAPATVHDLHLIPRRRAP